MKYIFIFSLCLILSNLKELPKDEMYEPERCFTDTEFTPQNISKYDCVYTEIANKTNDTHSCCYVETKIKGADKIIDCVIFRKDSDLISAYVNFMKNVIEASNNKYDYYKIDCNGKYYTTLIWLFLLCLIL